MKNLSDEYNQKHVTLQNVLDIQLATYNKDACVAFRDDYEPIVKVAMKLINDPNVKPKQKAKYSELVKKMKNFRNVINLIAVINVLAVIAAYQKWGQREKASAFERKGAVNKLKN